MSIDACKVPAKILETLERGQIHSERLNSMIGSGIVNAKGRNGIRIE
jgi:hypothetical protein